MKKYRNKNDVLVSKSVPKLLLILGNVILYQMDTFPIVYNVIYISSLTTIATWYGIISIKEIKKVDKK